MGKGAKQRAGSKFHPAIPRAHDNDWSRSPDAFATLILAMSVSQAWERVCRKAAATAARARRE